MFIELKLNGEFDIYMIRSHRNMIEFIEGVLILHYINPPKLTIHLRQELIEFMNQFTPRSFIQAFKEGVSKRAFRKILIERGLYKW